MNDKTWHHYATIWAGVGIIATGLVQLYQPVTDWITKGHTVVGLATVVWPAAQVVIGSCVVAFRKLAANIVAPGILLALALCITPRPADAGAPLHARLFPTVSVDYEHSFLPGVDRDQALITPALAVGVSPGVAFSSGVGFGVHHTEVRWTAGVTFNLRGVFMAKKAATP